MSNHGSPKSHGCVPSMRPKAKFSTKRRKEIARAKGVERAEKRSNTYEQACKNLKSEY